MSPIQAEKFLGLEPSSRGLALVRRCLAKEKQIGKRFIIREGNVQVRWKFTEKMLRQYMPELWETRFERTQRAIVEHVKRVDQNMNERIDARIERHPAIVRLQEETSELDNRTVETARHVCDLAERVAKIAKEI